MLALFHPVWRRIQPSWRRAAYLAATEFAAPTLPPNHAIPQSVEQPYIVVGPLSAPTGLGEASRLVLHALIAAGRLVSCIDVTASLMQPSVVLIPDGLPPPPEGRGTIILTAQPPNTGHALAIVGQRLLRGKRRVGFWVWEVNALPQAWLRSRHLVHDIVAPSAFTARIFADGFGMPVACVPYPVAHPALADRPRRIRSESTVIFGCAMDFGSTVARKNPFAVIEAWQKAFPRPENARLQIRVRDHRHDPAALARIEAAAGGSAGSIVLVAEATGTESLDSWYDGIDVVISLHRAEGFGLVPAEAMHRGIPVIATDWSATAEFVTHKTGWPVPAKIVPAVDPAGHYDLSGARWAEPDIDAAALAIREAATDGGLRRQKGDAAAELVASRFTVGKFIAALEGGGLG